MPYGADASQYVARVLARYQLVRGVANVIACPIFGDAGQITPSAATVSIFRPGDPEDSPSIVSGGNADPSVAGFPRYTVAALSVPSTLPFEEDLRFVWSVTIDGVVHDFRFLGDLVRYPLPPVLTDLDLYRRNRLLDPSQAGVIHSEPDFAEKRAEAWTLLYSRLVRKGNRPNLIMEPDQLREAHLQLTLALIWEEFASTLNDAHQAAADRALDRYEAAWAGLSFKYAPSDDGGAAESSRRRAARPTVWLTGRS